MARQEPYFLHYVFATKRHLQAIDAKHRGLIREKIEEQLLFEPAVATRNRKPLEQPLFDASWELRFGPDNRFRVLYDIEEETRTVNILAIGEKQRSRLFIGGEEVPL